MSNLRVNSFSISIDGYGAGPNQSLENPFGVGGLALHEWYVATKTFNDFITGLFCRVDDAMIDCQKHSQAKLYPSEVVTLALLYALKGCGQRAFWRWLKANCQPLSNQEVVIIFLCPTFAMIDSDSHQVAS